MFGGKRRKERPYVPSHLSRSLQTKGSQVFSGPSLTHREFLQDLLYVGIIVELLSYFLDDLTAKDICFKGSLL